VGEEIVNTATLSVPIGEPVVPCAYAANCVVSGASGLVRPLGESGREWISGGAIVTSGVIVGTGVFRATAIGEVTGGKPSVPPRVVSGQVRPVREDTLQTPRVVTGPVRPVRPDTPTWQVEALKKLSVLGTLLKGWDSYGGLPLRSDVRQAAADLIDWTEAEDLPVPAVVLNSGGTVQFEWRYQGREVEVEVLGKHSLRFLKVHSDDRMEEGEVSGDLAEQVRRLVDWLRHGEPAGHKAPTGGLRNEGNQSAGTEPIAPDSDVPLTVAQMAEAFDKLGTPTTQQDVELSVDPDDYPLF
jgi:hypothetical protein